MLKLERARQGLSPDYAPEQPKACNLSKLVLVGSSGHSRVVLDAVEKQQQYEVVGFLDDFKPVQSDALGKKILGRTEDLPMLLRAAICNAVVVAIGDNWTRAQCVARIKAIVPDVKFATVIHPSATIATDVSIGCGTVVLPGAIVNAGCHVGEFCILNTGCSLDHDSVMEDFSSLGPGAVIGGSVSLGTYSVVAIGATIVHMVQIGRATVIGAGSTVLDDMPSEIVAYGTPARIIRRRKVDTPYLNRARRLPPLYE